MRKKLTILVIIIFIGLFFVLVFGYLQNRAAFKLPRECNQPSIEQFALDNGLVPVATSSIYWGEYYYKKDDKMYKIVTGIPCDISLKEIPSGSVFEK